MDLVYDKNIDKEEELINRLEGLKESAINVAGDDEGVSIFNQMRTSNSLVIQKQNRKFSAKLARLRIQKQETFRLGFRVSRGSRRISALKYKRKPSNGEPVGAPFPQNLRILRIPRISKILRISQDY